MKMKALVFCGMALLASFSYATLGGEEDSPSADGRVRKALDKTELKYMVDNDGDYCLLFSPEVVYINSQTETIGDLEVREVWCRAVKCEDGFSKEELLAMLKKNARVKIGAWQVLSDGKSAVFQCVVSANASGETLETAVRAVVGSVRSAKKEFLKDRPEEE